MSEGHVSKRAKKNDVNERFVTWLREHGVEWDATQIDPVASIAGGVGVRALRRIQVGDVLATISKTGGTVLSPQTCAAAQHVRAAQLEGGLAATVAMWLEQRHCLAISGHASKFAEYLNWERPAEDVPVRWPADARACLVGTDVESLVNIDGVALREDFDKEAWPVLEKAVPAAYLAEIDREREYDHFVAAATLVSSRAFGVDGHHGDCILPFAALFNHSTTQPHINVADKVDEEAAARGDKDDGDEDEEENADDDDDADDESSDLDRPSKVTHLQIVAVRAAEPGDELLNTYGYHLSNRKLLHSYGFCQVRKIDEQLHRATTVQLLREASEETTDFHFWAKIVRIFPNNCVSVSAALVREAITDENDAGFVEAMANAFTKMAEEGDDEDEDGSEKEKAKGSDDEDGGEKDDDDDDEPESSILPFGLIAPSADHNADEDDEEENVGFEGPDDYDFRALFVGNVLAVGVECRLVLLLRLLELDETARNAVVNDGIPLALLEEIDCLGALNGDEDETMLQHHPSDEHDATYAQLQQYPLLKHCNLGPKARSLLAAIVERRQALYASHAPLAAECHKLAQVLDAETPQLGREEFALMLRIGERSLLRLVLARLDLLHVEQEKK